MIITLTLEALTYPSNPNPNYPTSTTTPSPPLSPPIPYVNCACAPTPTPYAPHSSDVDAWPEPEPDKSPPHGASPQLTPQSHSASPLTPQPTLHPSLHCSRPPSSSSQLRTLSRVAPRAPCPRSAAASRQQLLSTSASLQYICHPSTVHGQCARSAYAVHNAARIY